MNTVRILISLSLLAGCGQAAEEPEAVDLGQISTGGKADDPLMAFDIDIEPGGTKAFVFETSGDLIASVTQADEESAGLTTVGLRDLYDHGGGIEVIYRDEFGTEVDEPVPSTSPWVHAKDVGGRSELINLRQYQVVIYNRDEEKPTRGKLVLSKPEPTDCTSFARPDRTFDPIAKCSVVLDGKLEDESEQVVKWADLCVGSGQRTDVNDQTTAKTIAVLGKYGHGRESNDYHTTSASQRFFAPIEKWDESGISAAYHITHAIQRRKTTLMGPEYERQIRDFVYMYDYDLNENVLELRVKSRPQIFPNYYWEMGATFSCEPIETP